MARTKRAKKPITAGQRVGTKRSDKRWMAPDSSIWASRFEYEVYTSLIKKGHDVRRCTEQDSIPYTSPVRLGKCRQCASADVVTERTYTPDLYVVPKGTGKSKHTGYYIEAKGYIRSERRSLLRNLRKAWPNLDLRVLAQRDYKVSAKRSLTEWVKDLMKCPVAVWDGDLPGGWQ